MSTAGVARVLALAHAAEPLVADTPAVTTLPAAA